MNDHHTRIHEAEVHGAGDTVGASSHFPGTYGCQLKGILDGRKYMLTCSHVIYNNSMDSANGPITEEIILFDFESDQPKRIGPAKVAFRTNDLDIGVVDLEDQSLPGDFDGQWREVTEADRVARTPFSFRGAVTKGGRAFIRLLDWPVKMHYRDGTVGMEDMIVVGWQENNEWVRVSRPGDSGSILADPEGKAVGMIIGGNDVMSYAIPMGRILEKLDMIIA